MFFVFMDFFLPPVVFSVGSFNDPSFNPSPFLPLRRLQRWLEREVQPRNTTISGEKNLSGVPVFKEGILWMGSAYNVF